jgi:hypothetical protein
MGSGHGFSTGLQLFKEQEANEDTPGDGIFSWSYSSG